MDMEYADSEFHQAPQGPRLPNISGFLESKIPDKEGDTTSHNIMPDAEARFSAAVR
jgi:hypothetical protein